MDRKGTLCNHVNPIILLAIDPCFAPPWPVLLLHPYGWLTRQLQLAALSRPMRLASVTASASPELFRVAGAKGVCTVPFSQASVPVEVEPARGVRKP